MGVSIFRINIFLFGVEKKCSQKCLSFYEAVLIFTLKSSFVACCVCKIFKKRKMTSKFISWSWSSLFRPKRKNLTIFLTLKRKILIRNGVFSCVKQIFVWKKNELPYSTHYTTLHYSLNVSNKRSFVIFFFFYANSYTIFNRIKLHTNNLLIYFFFMKTEL